MSDLSRSFDFLNFADRLKAVERANVLTDHPRRENTAEHSWHVALYAMVFGASDRVLAMILIHDLVEIEVGDQPVYLDHDAGALQAAEDAAAARVFAMLPKAQGAALLALWREFEQGQTPDAVFAKRMDHVQPLFQVVMAPRPVPEHLEIARGMMSGGRIARFRQEWPEAIAAGEGLLNGQAPEGDLGRQLAFLTEADKLKTVERANTLIDLSRQENSAEHSWHLALYALILGGQAAPGVDIGRAIRMLILHDLVEIDVGDVPLHSANGQAHHAPEVQAAEAEAARRIFGLLPPVEGAAFLALWQEFEANETPDAVFAKSLDRTQPMVQHLASDGVGWRRFGVSWANMQTRVAPQVRRGLPGVWNHLEPAVQGWFARNAPGP
ncbi:MAG: HD domain-containing protein [Paracoccus sp. (in: a-proteobacteria)]